MILVLNNEEEELIKEALFEKIPRTKETRKLYDKIMKRRFEEDLYLRNNELEEELPF